MFSEIFTPEWRCFLEVARQSNVSKAADTLQLPQPSVTKYLKRLEESLDLKLFERSNRGAKLTQSGWEIFNQLNHHQTQIAASLQHSMGKQNEVTGSVSFGFHRVLGLNYFSAQMSELYRSHPDLTIHTKMTTSLEVSRLVANGSLDYGLVANPIQLPGLVVRPYLREDVAIYASRECALEKIERVFYNSEMQLLPRIMRKLKHCKTEGISDYDFIADLVRRNSKLAGVLPEGVAKRFKLHAKISEVFYQASVALIFRSGIERSKRHEAIVQSFVSV